MRSFLIVIVLLLTSSCGKVIANSARAEVVPSPLPGYTCFVVYSPEGNAVGRNCIKE